jgi:hypothetical protein
LGRATAGARSAGIDRRYASVAVLLAGLGLTGCVNTGLLADLIEERPNTTIAFESIDGPPSAVFHKFVDRLKEQAGAQQLSVVVPSQANYRVRVYFAAHDADGTTSIAWAWDVYDIERRRAFRLTGEEKAGGAGRQWEAADDAILQRVARASIQQFTVMSAARGGADTARASPLQSTAPGFGWFDDWAPEASGIFRILRRAPSPPEIAPAASRPLPPEEVPLPNGRPAPPGEASDARFAALQNVTESPASGLIDR